MFELTGGVHDVRMNVELWFEYFSFAFWLKEEGACGQKDGA